ncbi:unnamed protein product [Oikopleura dioica]|uniref:Dynein heavy chain tail domain-containing protein n=1 Tax=Oikopleura dioica TaxID=34765 RepID=E4YLH2_OIKDI|nr:unnamed protein product [Oikopleura dioica]
MSEIELSVAPPETVVDIFRNSVEISGWPIEKWTDEHHTKTVHDYCKGEEPLLLIFLDKDEEIQMLNRVPQNFDSREFIYMIKKPEIEVTFENFFTEVQTGSIVGQSAVESLLRLMHGVYAPIFLDTTSLPETISNDFSARMHRFLASLTDVRHKMDGKTVLYIPEEKKCPDDYNEAIKDKELVGRLEATMIQWTRQIKEVLSAQEAVETNENAGPLDEIEFWNNRCKDLSGLSKQLDLEGVKRVQKILSVAKLSYVNQFDKLSKLIQDGSTQAQSNLKYLMILKEPCTKLGISHPKDVPAQLTTIIRLIRIIWTNSPHYNTRERLTSLFRKLSNEIIRICCKSISLDAIFDGRVKSSIRNLIECIECCNKWKQIYRKTALSQHKYSSQGWVLDQSSIFAQIDAFVQRCKDLIEVCNCQIHFARWEDGEKTRMPILGGQRGPEVTRSLLEIEETFRKNLHNLMKAENAILDVKNTSWHEVFTRFRTAVKELEVMVQNLITSAFDTVKSVDDGVMLLKIFGHFKSREAIKRTIDKKTVDVMLILSDELNAVKKELWSKRSSKAFYDLPQHAGQAYQARLLRRRIDRSFKVVNDAKWLVKTGSGEEIKASYIQLTTALDEFIRKVFNEWALTVDRDSYKKLESPLMTRSELQKNLLDMNFDPYLLKLFSEIQFWEILMFEIPHYAADVYQRRDELRSLRENVLLVVRDYNRIIQDLDEDEIGLFRERIKVLDKKVQPGLSKLNWSNGTGSEYYITDCRAHASKVMQIVTGYKSGNQTINNVQKEEAIVMINFVLLDSNPIKLSISRHCQEWLDKFTGLLSRRATKRLTSIMSFMEENGAAVTTPPEDLDQLSDRIELYENLKASLEEKNRELPVIREHFLILEKYEVTVPMETLDLLDTMQEGYNKYAASVHEAEEMIKKSKDKFKSNLLSNADEFKKTVANNRDEYIRDGPFGTNTSPTDALQAIAQYFENCEALRMKEKSIRRGLSIFKIDQNIVPDTLEQKAAVCFKDISKRQREAKDKDNWTIVKSTKDTIVRFQRTMPLVTDLKNPAMRDRHWLEIKEDIAETRSAR